MDRKAEIDRRIAEIEAGTAVLIERELIEEGVENDGESRSEDRSS